MQYSQRALLSILLTAICGAAHADRVVLIILDGLRPDYVTAEAMPTLHRMAAEGIRFENHHATYPTVTRVNATSISTGCYPAKHGIMDNTIYIPEHDAAKTFSTASREHLQAIDGTLGGNLVQMPSLAGLLEADGKGLLVVSSGSDGSALLLNHRIQGHGIINTGFILPENLARAVTERIGVAPEEDWPNAPRNAYAVDAYLQYALPELDPDVTVFWLSDPDHTAHKFGMGSPKTVEALRRVDGEAARILEGLKTTERWEQTTFFVTSDHGFSTHTAPRSPMAEFRQLVVDAGAPADSFISAGFGIYLRERADTLTPKLVELMQRNKWVGPIFTRSASPGSVEGWVAGTLSMERIRYEHERAPDILFSPQWTNGENAFGFAGETLIMGMAGHGSASPWDIHNTLIAMGPHFKQGTVNAAPTHNVDLAPTILTLLGMPAPDHMDGRVLREAWRGEPALPHGGASSKTVSNATTTGTVYSALLHESTAGDSRYFDYAEARRDEP